MKSVILFRHGKSDWGAHYSTDHERPLSKRGINASKKMGLYLKRRDNFPELILSSTSLRTKSTIQLAVKEGKWPTEIIYDSKLYEASLNDVMDILKKQDDNLNKICIVGHEPVLSLLILKSRKANWEKFPTASMAKINFISKKWVNIKFGVGSSELVWLVKPKDLD